MIQNKHILPKIKYDIMLWAYIVVFATIIIYSNWNYDYLFYAEYRTKTLETLLNQIKGGTIPDFLGISIHSWGFTLYLPYIAYIFGIDNITSLFLYIQLICAWMVLVFFSIEIYYLTGKNKLMTALSPILLHIFCGNILYGFKTQTFWTAAPVVILGLPILCFIYRSQSYKKRAGFIILLGLLCSLANVMRNQTAFPIAIVAVLLFAWHFFKTKSIKGFLHLLLEIALFYICYYLICTYIPYLAGMITGSSVLDNEGFVWHSFLCGLGVVENPYGLAWSDEVVSDIIKERYGYTAYSNEYLQACKEYFFFIVKENPGFVVSTWLKKFYACMRWAFQILYYPMNMLEEIHPYGEIWCFAGAKGCLRNLSVPTVLATLYVAASMIKYKLLKNKIYRQNIVFLIAAFAVIIVTGTVQGVIGYTGYITYYMPTVAGMSACPLFLFLYCFHINSKNGNEKMLKPVPNNKENALMDRNVSIVITAYNEEESLSALYGQIRDSIERCMKKSLIASYDIWFVNDGSTDATEEKILLLHEKDANVHLISFRKNMGKSIALNTAFHHVKKEGLIFTMDADLQDDPSEFERFIRKIEEGYDLVVGWKKQRFDSLEKRIPSKLFNKVTSKLSGLELHDFDCGFKCFRGEVIASLEIYGELHRYIPVLAYRNGFNITEIEVQHHKRMHGKSKYGLERYMRGLLDAFTTIFLLKYFDRPMYLFGRIGIVFFICGGVVCSALTLEWFRGQPIGGRPALILGVLFIVVGIQLIMTGLLGNLLVDISHGMTYNEHYVKWII